MEKEKKLPHFELTGTIMQSGLPVGLLVNFRRWKLEWKRLQLQDDVVEETIEESVPF